MHTSIYLLLLTFLHPSILLLTSSSPSSSTTSSLSSQPEIPCIRTLNPPVFSTFSKLEKEYLCTKWHNNRSPLLLPSSSSLASSSEPASNNDETLIQSLTKHDNVTTFIPLQSQTQVTNPTKCLKSLQKLTLPTNIMTAFCGSRASQNSDQPSECLTYHYNRDDFVIGDVISGCFNAGLIIPGVDKSSNRRSIGRKRNHNLDVGNGWNGMFCLEVINGVASGVEEKVRAKSKNKGIQKPKKTAKSNKDIEMAQAGAEETPDSNSNFSPIEFCSHPKTSPLTTHCALHILTHDSSLYNPQFKSASDNGIAITRSSFNSKDEDGDGYYVDGYGVNALCNVDFDLVIDVDGNAVVESYLNSCPLHSSLTDTTATSRLFMGSDSIVRLCLPSLSQPSSSLPSSTNSKNTLSQQTPSLQCLAHCPYTQDPKLLTTKQRQSAAGSKKELEPEDLTLEGCVDMCRFYAQANSSSSSSSNSKNKKNEDVPWPSACALLMKGTTSGRKLLGEGVAKVCSASSSTDNDDSDMSDPDADNTDPSPTAIYQCVKTMLSTTASTSNIISLCKQTKQTADPSACFKVTARIKGLLNQDAIDACIGSPKEKSGVMSCLKGMQILPLFEGSAKAQLCTGLEGESFGVRVAECAVSFKKGGASGSSIKSSEVGGIPDSVVVRLCRSGLDDSGEGVNSVAQCFGQAPSLLSIEFKTKLCLTEKRATVNVKHFKTGRSTDANPAAYCMAYALDKAGYFDVDLLIKLCISPSSSSVLSPLDESEITAPITCLQNSPFQSSPLQILTLCSEARTVYPQTCAKHLLHASSLPAMTRAKICAGAMSVVPAICAEVLPSFIKTVAEGGAGNGNEIEAVLLCNRAVTLTPAYCARHYTTSQIQHGLTLPQLLSCKHAQTTPSKVFLRSISYEGESLMPGSSISGVLEVLDQFGEVMREDNETFVIARLDGVKEFESELRLQIDGGEKKRKKTKKKSETWNTGVLEGKRVQRVVDGIASFEGLKVTSDGSFTLRFFLSSSDSDVDIPMNSDKKEKKKNSDRFKTGRSPDSTSIRLSVGQDPDTLKMLTVCSGLFESFSCMPYDTASSSSQSKSHTATRSADGVEMLDTISIIPFPTSLKFTNCLDILEKAGFRTSINQSGDIWLHSHSAISLLSSGSSGGLPNALQTPWEVLGIQVGSSKSEIRRAYIVKSLEWHPDRWRAWPALMGKVDGIFEIVSKAYTELRVKKELKVEG